MRGCIDDTPAISVVVLAYQNKNTVAEAVESLLNQDCSEPVEIIVVISGGDGAAQLVAARFPSVTVIESTAELLPGATRNRGVAASSGRVIAFLAGDCLAEAGWIRRRLTAHRVGHRAVASAVTHAGPRTPTGWGFYYAQCSPRLPGRPAGSVPYPDGGHHGVSFDRDLLMALGPFAEDVRIGEDTDMVRRLSEAGVQVWYEPSIRTAHRAPAGLRQMIRDQFARGRRRAQARGAPRRPMQKLDAHLILRRWVREGRARLWVIMRQAWRYGHDERWRLVFVFPWVVIAAAANQAGWTRELCSLHDASAAPRVRHLDRWLAAGAAMCAAILYATTAHADWIWDSLRYAEWMEDGPFDQLLIHQHAFGNLVPLGIFEALSGLGLEVSSLDVLTYVNVTGAAAAVGLTYLTARRLGGSTLAAVASTATVAVSFGVWRGGGSAGVYGTTLAAIALAWFTAAGYATRPGVRSAAVLGGAVGLAVATHLATVALAPAALFLAVALGPTRAMTVSRDKMKTAVVFSSASVVVVLSLMAITAGVVRGWSPPAILAWFLTPRFGGTADPQSAVGFGLDGLEVAIAGTAELPGGGEGGQIPMIIAGALILLVVGRAGIMLVRDRRGRTLAAALLIHGLVAVLAASWYQALRVDYFTLALIPVALLWPVGGPALASGALRPGVVPVLVTAGIVGSLALWNLTTAVLPSLERSQSRASAAHVIVEASPRDARLLLSPVVVPRVAYEGLEAQTGWGALLFAVQDGARKPGLNEVLVAASQRPLLVSTKAFELTPGQTQFLGATPDEIWSHFHTRCLVSSIADFETDLGSEELYLIQDGCAGAPKRLEATLP